MATNIPAASSIASQASQAWPFSKCNKPGEENRNIWPGRKPTIVFRSLAVKYKYLPVVKLLANGSVQKAIDTLFNMSEAQTSKAIRKRLSKEIKRLVSTKSSLVQSGGNLEETSFHTAEVFVRHNAPFLWKTLTKSLTERSGGKSVCNNNKILMAIAIMCSVRSRNAIMLQRYVMLAIQSFKQKREIFVFLNKLGITASRQTCYKDQGEPAAKPEEDVGTSQKEVAANSNEAPVVFHHSLLALIRDFKF